MKILQRYVIDYDIRVAEVLEYYNIEYDDNRSLLDFQVYSSHSCISAIKNLVPNIEPLYSLYKFSNEEMDEAEWFTMRSTNKKLENVLDERTFDYSCKYTRQVNTWAPNKAAGTYYVREDIDSYGHETQVAPYYFSKKIKWGRNFFYSVFRRGAEDFFCNTVAKNIITQNGLKGASFLPPLKKQTNEPMEDAYQFIINNIIPESSCEVVDYRDIYHCPVCGKKEYGVYSLSRVRVKKNLLGDQDFYATEPIYTCCDGWCIPDRFSIISHRAYEVFKASGFTSTLELFPLLTY